MKYWPFKVICVDDKSKIEVKYKLETKSFTPEEISSMILTKMKQVAEAYLGEKVSSAVINVPAYFNASQRQATKAAALMAGLNPLRILSEPEAAAIAYGLDRQNIDYQKILVFDLGGGTFNLSILKQMNEHFLVESTSGK
jgi:L1 cell adhesion molecule like protein